jgi:simple sugar transport system ATP-binding protein
MDGADVGAARPQAVRNALRNDACALLAAEGCSILYISHKLDEIQELCHTATVLRTGKVTGTCRPGEETPKSMARMMIGRDLPVCEHSAPVEGGTVQLRIAGLSHATDDPFGTDLKDIHLDVHAGEIIGIAGVSGNGQQELLYALSGEAPIAEKYPVQICGTEVGRMRAGRRRRLGLGFVPEERLGRGAVPRMSLAGNALLTAWRQGMLKLGLIDRAKVRTFATTVIERFNVKCGGPDALARSLSGGNLQKFIVGREILLDPKLIIVAQPTWGVDVGAAAFIRQAIIDLRNAGTAVLVVSEELDELFEICDRIAVIANGRLSPVKRVADTNVEEIGVWMSGMWPDAHADATTGVRAGGHA